MKIQIRSINTRQECLLREGVYCKTDRQPCQDPAREDVLDALVGLDGRSGSAVSMARHGLYET